MYIIRKYIGFHCGTFLRGFQGRRLFMTADLETQTLNKMTVCSAEVKRPMTQQTSESAHFPPPISIFSGRQLLSPSYHQHNIYNDC